jgi:hypothetical protein
MATQNYSCGQVDIPHQQLKQLRENGHLQLGMDDRLAMEISNNPKLGPAKPTTSLAFHLWNWVAIGGFVYTVYLSFTDAWWWFIPGLILMSVVFKSNKKGNTQNLLEAAFDDGDFYERVREVGGWVYQMDEEQAAKFLR